MCELLALTGPRPFPVRDLLPIAAAVERWGIAGMGWGLAWIDARDGRLRHYKHETALRDDERAAHAIGDATTTTALVHLRRPSLLSTIQPHDTQPFVSADDSFAFAHNGELRRHGEYRARYAARDLLRGRADTEVGFHFLADLLRDMEPARALVRLQDAMGGPNNLLYLGGDGLLLAYSASEENPVYRFRLDDRIGVVTALYSRDRAVFDLALPDATYLDELPIGQAMTLTERSAVRA